MKTEKDINLGKIHYEMDIYNKFEKIGQNINKARIKQEFMPYVGLNFKAPPKQQFQEKKMMWYSLFIDK